MKPVKIKYEDLEDGRFLLGLRLAHALSTNHLKRLALAKHERKLKRLLREPMAERADMVREFGTLVTVASKKYPHGRQVMEVNPDTMDPEKAKTWLTALNAWRDKELEFDFDSTREDGLLEIPLWKEDLAEFPAECLAVMCEYVHFREAEGENPNKDKRRIKELELQLRAAEANSGAEG